MQLRWQLALALAGVGLFAASAQAAPRLRLASRYWGVVEVHGVDARGDHLLQRFRAPEDVQASAVSRDGRFAFVWHHPDHSARRLSFFDLTTMRKTAEITPGVGGDFAFTPGDHVFHSWGCGTNCTGWRVYGVRGRVVLETVTSGVKASPDHRFAVSYPSLIASTEPLVVYALDSGRAIVTRRIAGYVREVRWDRDHHLRFATEDRSGRVHHGSVVLPQ